MFENTYLTTAAGYLIILSLYFDAVSNGRFMKSKYYEDYYEIKIIMNYEKLRVWKGRSQWPCGLRHELSSLARTLESWVRIPLKAWMSVYALILCLCCPVCRGGLVTG
jgi:hypothetical protein